ncbi:stage V sporulation protein E [Ammoniphilus oxalaticus]|uniref:Stage V sporulation protein E n=1 Tax=Ammoniphilus oxalaticus TaxID=66863 RepID=A0A419SG17_9BACL|nr:stage V sporulation protein E [Ammoniphilus oxalaticus]RKD22724.1 stage V sporulation protein E [Ammoniphilus oxalaticus]
MQKLKRTPDFLMILTVLILLAVGMVMVYSSSSAIAATKGDSFFFVKRQLLFGILGVILMFVNIHIHYSFWKRWAKTSFVIACILLALVLVVGEDVKGAKRWLGIHGLGIQPSEFAKLSLIFLLAKWLPERRDQFDSLRKGLFPPLFAVGIALFLIMLQPDLGMAIVLLGTALLMIFIAGCRIRHLAGLMLIGSAGIVILTLAAPYRLKRVTSFLDPWQDPFDSGFQLVQSLYAIGSGRVTGLGLGMSRQKFYYLPEPYNDFIFAILAEELGFVGGMFILLLFLLFFWRGYRVAITAKDSFGSFLAAGIVSMIGIQVIFNVGIVTGSLPITGITLPFLSYGGSSLTLLLASVGVLLNISRYVEISSR